MGWAGKLLGGAFGFMLGGPIGALLGASFGHNFDRGVERVSASLGNSGGGNGWGLGGQQRIQTAFFTATFSVMGHVAKADGKVTADEIKMAHAVMDHLQLDAKLRKAAQKLFNEGKKPDFPLDDLLQQFKKEASRRTTIIQMFMEIQLQAAYADGVLHPAEKRLLLKISAALGISRPSYDQLESMVKAGISGRSSTQKPSLAAAYQTLGIKSNATDPEVKRAYRRLMGQHHPDKLVSKGLPEEMMKIASEKTHQIKMAYDSIKEHRSSK
ncbi:MAG: co-chaperone DjlA [Thiotrichales bacterium]|jgi:DnaJ like chaperone protein|nr:co-chaperone DjlA [Thiotrichales bacterium]MBT3613214.1 co-chaperone DjlA [Thiotrichales bacterium]MBT3752444.1 co-chaperone DjlA [Thiotrichales bacterium]MBT3836968.1 co-chaperone DjlA [Thiotrichales bacterium]MBT4152725.1 co-chaperone DjlA [Thiotrichales bacterium]